MKNLEVSKKDVSQSANDILTNNITSSPTDILTTIDSPLLVTTPLLDILKDSALFSAVIPPENSFPSLPKHSNCDQKLQSHLALSMVNNVTTGTVNAALIAKANKSETHYEVSHSLHLKQWELAVQSLCDYINCDSLSLLMAYLKGKRVWATRLSSMYTRPMWEDGCWVSMTKLHLIMTKFYLMSLFSLKKSYKLRMNSNKFEKK